MSDAQSPQTGVRTPYELRQEKEKALLSVFDTALAMERAIDVLDDKLAIMAATSNHSEAIRAAMILNVDHEETNRAANLGKMVAETETIIRAMITNRIDTTMFSTAKRAYEVAVENVKARHRR